MPDSTLNVRQGDGSQIALALFASIAIHALILVLVSGQRDRVREEQPDSPALIARLAEARAVPSRSTVRAETPSPMPETARVPERAPVQPVRSPRPTPAVRHKPVMAPPPTVSVATPAAEPVQAAPSRTVPASLVGSGPGAPVPAPSAAPVVEVEAIDSASVGQYRTAIIAAARRYREYPRVALENGWEGRAEVHLAINANGSIASINIRTRSGYVVLDRQALEMIRKAKPMAPMPPALRGKSFTLDLPVLFSLTDGTS